MNLEEAGVLGNWSGNGVVFLWMEICFSILKLLEGFALFTQTFRASGNTQVVSTG